MPPQFRVPDDQVGVRVEQRVEERADGILPSRVAPPPAGRGLECHGLARLEDRAVEPLAAHGPGEEDHGPGAPPSHVGTADGVGVGGEVPPDVSVYPRPSVGQ